MYPHGLYPQWNIHSWFKAPIEYNLMIYSPNGKDMVLRKIVFRSGNRHGKS